MVSFTGPYSDSASFIGSFFQSKVENLFLRVPRGEMATGTDTLLVADIKDALRSKWPAEFPQDSPPKLYVQLHHKSYRQGFFGPWSFDVWTGELSFYKMEISDLKSW